MTTKQAVILSMLAGVVVIVFSGLAVAILTLPEELLPIIVVTPTRTATIPPTITLTPTLPNFMPVDSSPTETAEPTPINTRVPTLTPRPKSTATPTVVIEIPTPIILPSATPTETPRPLPTSKPVVVSTPTVHKPLGYYINFDAQEKLIVEGECTDLTWRVEGSSAIFLNGDLVQPSGRKKVCPKETKVYKLEVQLANSTMIDQRQVEIEVEEEDDLFDLDLD